MLAVKVLSVHVGGTGLELVELLCKEKPREAKPFILLIEGMGAPKVPGTSLA